MKDFLNNRNIDRVTHIASLHHFCKLVQENEVSDFSTVQKEFEAAFDEHFMQELIEFELRKINVESFYTPTKSTYNSIEIVDAKTFKINLVNIKVRDLLSRTVLTGFSHDKIVLSLNKESICYSLYHQPNPDPVDIFDATRGINNIKKRAYLNYGESLFIKKHSDVFSYEGADSDQMVTAVILTTKQAASFDWEYSSETLLPIRIVGDQDECRIEQTCKMLGELGHTGSLPVLRSLLDHPKHNIRWAAVRNLMLIDFDEGINALKISTQDVHPEVKQAANRALKQLQPQD